MRALGFNNNAYAHNNSQYFLLRAAFWALPVPMPSTFLPLRVDGSRERGVRDEKAGEKLFLLRWLSWRENNFTNLIYPFFRRALDLSYGHKPRELIKLCYDYVDAFSDKESDLEAEFSKHSAQICLKALDGAKYMATRNTLWNGIVEDEEKGYSRVRLPIVFALHAAQMGLGKSASLCAYLFYEWLGGLAFWTNKDTFAEIGRSNFSHRKVYHLPGNLSEYFDFFIFSNRAFLQRIHKDFADDFLNVDTCV